MDSSSGQKMKQNLKKYPYNILLGFKTFEGEGMAFLPDVQKYQTPLCHVAEDLNPRYRSANLSSRILLLFIALEYCTNWPQPLVLPHI